MARGTTRAPSQNAYRGALGRTQTTTVHLAGPRGDLVPAQVYTTIDAVTDPELVDRLHSEDPARALNVIRLDGAEPVRVAVPVLYHDPAAELLVLVLGDAHRHRELDERIRILERLRADDAPVPAYAKDLAVVYGASGLRNYLERRAQEALEAARMHEQTRELERRRADLAAREAELERTRLEHDKRVREFERRAIELDVAKAELVARDSGLAARGTELAARESDLERARVELERSRVEIERLRSEARHRVIAQAQATAVAPAPAPAPTPVPVPMPAPAPRSAARQGSGQSFSEGEATLIGPPPERETDVETKPVPKSPAHDMELTPPPEPLPAPAPAVRPVFGPLDTGELTGILNSLEVAALPAAQEPTQPSARVFASGGDPVTTETADLKIEQSADAWLDRAVASNATTIGVDGSGGVRLALVIGEQLARGLTADAIDVRILLHRVATYPAICLLIGPAAAFRAPTPAQLAVLVLDIASDRDRAVLSALGRRFELTVDIVCRGRWLRRARLSAPLHDNVGYIVRAAEDHLRGVTAEGEASLQRARELVLGAGFDLLGVEQPDAAEFRDDKLAQLDTAQHLRRAIAIARKFVRPSREDYLVCARGFPLPRWRELRRHVLERAVAWGLWMGPELAQIAVSEGLARSRRDLVVRLDRGFEQLRRHPSAFDIDGDAAEDNAKAIAEEARSLGVELSKTRNGAFSSDEVSQVSGSIGGTPAQGIPRARSTEELIALLDDKQQRLDAALQLCERADPRAAAPVINAAAKMGRADAVRVLGMAVKFGAAAKVPLLEGMASSKAFLRHGCALALALLRSEDGTQAVIDLLLTEPTEIWREVARAIGQVGPPALLPLASTYGRLGDSATPVLAERVAWAMAHVAVRGGKAAVETMAGGQSVVAPVARRALEFHASAANDQVRVRPGANGSQPGRDVTVNRAFSRRFFEALEQGMPEAAPAGLVDLEAAASPETLDESDLIEEDDEAAELDESDLLQG